MTKKRKKTPLKHLSRGQRTDEQRPAKPLVEAYDPFEQMFRPKRPVDSFGELFEEKILNDDF